MPTMVNEEPPLPAGWEEEVDEESGDKYYISPDGETQWERPEPETSTTGGLKGALMRSATAQGITLPPVDDGSKPPLPKMASLLPKIERKREGLAKEDRPIRGKIAMASGTKDQQFLYIPDDLILGEKRDKLNAQKLLSLVRVVCLHALFRCPSSTGCNWSSYCVRVPRSSICRCRS